MSTTTNAHTHDTTRRVSTETKASFKATEFMVFIAAVVGVLIASAVVDDNPGGFSAHEAWKFITFLAIGYMVSRGLAKSGSRDFYDDNRNSQNV